MPSIVCILGIKMNFFVSNRLWMSFSSGFSAMTNLFRGYSQDSSDLKIAAVILLLSALVLFLFLVILIYVKAMVMFVQRQSAEEQEEKAEAKAKQEKSRKLEMEIEMEKELERELEKARISRINTEQQEFISKQHIIENEEKLAKAKEYEEHETIVKKEQEQKEEQEKNRKQDDFDRELKEMQMRENAAKLTREREEKQKEKKKQETDLLDLDWKKGQQQRIDNEQTILSTITLQYQQQKKSLNDLLGLIMNMLSRNVDDFKIAQTIKFRAQKESLEDDILQTIESIKGFVSLCNLNKFSVYKAEGLPSEEQALYNLSKGDTSMCLALLEKLMNDNIDKASRARLEQKRDALFAETSECATIFASLASINDIMLATGSFELAIELSPKNVNAWNKLGDMYMRAEAQDKAVWAYNNLLNMADPTIYARQVANANKALSDYYYSQGDSVMAAKMYNESKRYYDSIGINNDLSARESDIINIIEEKQEENMHHTIALLLRNRVRA